jgi:glycosyltransferase involved in cell wall biosynthesis
VPDRGIYHAFNKALDHVTGDWIYFLGCDDYFWQADVLEKLAPHLLVAHPRHRVLFARAACVRPSGRVVEIRGKPWEHVKRLPPAAWTLGHPATLHHHELFARHGKFDEDFRIVGDFELLLRELKSSDACYVPDIIVSAFELYGMSSNPKYILTRIDERRRALRKHKMSTRGRSFGRSYITYATYNLVRPVLGERLAVSTATELIYMAGFARRIASRAKALRFVRNR